jgi:tRNA(fMet)-specific endonuclease VapC
MSFLIDTDICSAQLKRNSLVTARFVQYQGRVHLSVLTLAELYVWALRAKAAPRRLKDLHALLGDVIVLDATSDVARCNPLLRRPRLVAMWLPLGVGF